MKFRPNVMPLLNYPNSQLLTPCTMQFHPDGTLKSRGGRIKTLLATPTANLIYPNLTIQNYVCTHFVNLECLAGITL
jgi:hypothetical protein